MPHQVFNHVSPTKYMSGYAPLVVGYAQLTYSYAYFSDRRDCWY